jgi:hypothetical protein
MALAGVLGGVQRSGGVSAEHAGEGLERGGAQCVVGPDAALVAGEDPGIDEHLEMVGDGGLGQAEGFGQLADAGLAALVSGDDGDQAEPGGVGKGFEGAGEVGGLVSGYRLAQQRRAAVLGEREREPALSGGRSGHLPSMD